MVNGFSLLSLEALNLPVPTIQATFLTCLENDAYIFALTYYNGSSHVSPSYNNNSASIIGTFGDAAQDDTHTTDTIFFKAHLSAHLSSEQILFKPIYKLLRTIRSRTRSGYKTQLLLHSTSHTLILCAQLPTID